MAAAPPKPWVSPSEQMAQAVEQTGGITRASHGALIKRGSSAAWDLQQEWRGKELTRASVVKSNWSQGWLVRFLAPGHTQLGTFTLTLDGAISAAEAQQIGQTYLTILNLRRKDAAWAPEPLLGGGGFTQEY